MGRCDTMFDGKIVELLNELVHMYSMYSINGIYFLDENKDYFVALKKLIEIMYEEYGGPVVLIAHSMGNMYSLYFLNQQTQDWKDKYIRDFVSLGAPWGGVVKALRVLASGECTVGGLS